MWFVRWVRGSNTKDYTSSLFDISELKNIDVLRLEKLCVKVARAEQTYGNMYMHICEVLKNREGETLELFLLNVACAMG